MADDPNQPKDLNIAITEIQSAIQALTEKIEKWGGGGGGGPQPCVQPLCVPCIHPLCYPCIQFCVLCQQSGGGPVAFCVQCYPPPCTLCVGPPPCTLCGTAQCQPCLQCATPCQPCYQCAQCQAQQAAPQCGTARCVQCTTYCTPCTNCVQCTPCAGS